MADKTPDLLTEENAAIVTFEVDDNGAVNSLGTFLQIEMLKFNKLLKKVSAFAFAPLLASSTPLKTLTLHPKP